MRGRGIEKHQLLEIPVRTTSKVRAMELAGKKHPSMIAIDARRAKR